MRILVLGSGAREQNGHQVAFLGALLYAVASDAVGFVAGGGITQVGTKVIKGRNASSEEILHGGCQGAGATTGASIGGLGGAALGFELGTEFGNWLTKK